MIVHVPLRFGTKVRVSGSSHAYVREVVEEAPCLVEGTAGIVLAATVRWRDAVRAFHHDGRGFLVGMGSADDLADLVTRGWEGAPTASWLPGRGGLKVLPSGDSRFAKGDGRVTRTLDSDRGSVLASLHARAALLAVDRDGSTWLRIGEPVLQAGNPGVVWDKSWPGCLGLVANAVGVVPHERSPRPGRSHPMRCGDVARERLAESLPRGATVHPTSVEVVRPDLFVVGYGDLARKGLRRYCITLRSMAECHGWSDRLAALGRVVREGTDDELLEALEAEETHRGGRGSIIDGMASTWRADREGLGDADLSSFDPALP